MPVKPKLRTVKLDVRFPPNLKARVVQEAARMEMTVTAYVEMALRNQLDRTRAEVTD